MQQYAKPPKKAKASAGTETKVSQTLDQALGWLAADSAKRILVSGDRAFFTTAADKLAGLTFAVWGLAFKPRTDDMREAPSITIVDELLAAGAKVKAYDPEALRTARQIFGDRIGLCNKSYDAIADADALAVVTEWNEFREPDFSKVHQLLKTPVIFDGRNIYSPEQMRAHGFTYYSIGR